MEEIVRNAGSDLFGDMSQGAHSCLFYHKKADLAERIIPYLKSGLQNREFCIWILPEDLREEEAKQGLRRIIPDLDYYIEKAQIEIISQADLNTKIRNFDSQEAANLWAKKLNQAFNKGFSGLRLAQDLSLFKEKEENACFLDYEKELNKVVNSSQITALCSYPLEKYSSAEIFEAIEAHEFSLIKKERNWEQIEISKSPKPARKEKPKNAEDTFISSCKGLEECVRERTADLMHSNMQLETEIEEYKRTEEALRESEERFGVLIEAVAQAVWETDAEGAVVSDSPSWRAFTGQTLKEWLEYGWVNAIHPEDREYAKRLWREAVAAKRNFNAEFRLRNPDRNWKWVNVLAAPLRNPEGRIIKWVAMNIDITEHKQAEEALHMAYEEMQAQAEDLEAQTEELRKTNEALGESEKRFKLLSEVNALLLSSKDPEATIQTIAGELTHYINCDVFFSYIFDEALGKLRLNAYSGISAEAAKEIEWLEKWDRYPIISCVACDYCLNFAQNLQADRDKKADLLESMWVKSYTCQPLQIGEKTIGMLFFGTKNMDGLKKDELTLMNAVANQISTAIERKRTEKILLERESRQAFLFKLGDRIRELTNPEQIMQVTLELLGQYLKVSRAGYAEVDDSLETAINYDWIDGTIPSSAGRHFIKDWGPEIVETYLRGEIWKVEDVQTDSRSGVRDFTDAYKILNIRATVAIPLIRAGKWVALIFLHNTFPRVWKENEAELIKGVGERTWEAVERSRAENALRQTKEQYQTLFNSINEGFAYYKAIYDKEGRIYDLLIVEINPAGASLTGVERETQIGKTLKEIWPGMEDYWLEVYRKVDRTGESTHFEDFSNITSRWHSVQIDRVQKGRFVVTFRDITEFKEEEHRINRYNKVLEGISQIFTNAVQADTEKDLGDTCLYVALDVSESQIGFIGVIGADGLLHDIAISNMGWEQCYMYDKTGHSRPPGNFNLEGLYGSVINNGKSFFINNPPLHSDSIGLPDGHPLIASFLGVPFILNGKVKGILAVANREGGYSWEQQEDLEALAPAIIQSIERKKIEQEREQAQDALNKAYLDLEEKVKIRTSELETAYNSLKENERRLSEAQKIAHIGYWDWDILNNKLYWSEEIYLIFRVHPQKFGNTYEAFLSFIHPEDLGYVENAIKKALAGTPYSIDFRVVLEEGEERIVHVQGKVLFNNKNSPVLMRGTLQDITEKKHAEQAFLGSVAARKKEIHHRIKNNLQVISSLLDLQAEKFGNKECLENSEILEAFKESQDRVVSMALIHEELHEGGGNDWLNFSQYLEKLTEHLFMTYTLENVEISLNMNLQKDIFFDMDTAVPLGIIVNELVSNSLKYAFSGREKGEIRISLYREENQEFEREIPESTDEEPACSCEKNYTLIVSDDGIGISDTISLEDADTLGIQLVTILVDQLDGKIELNRNTGTEFIIKIPIAEEI